MQSPVKITFRGFPQSAAVETNIRKKAEWLEHFYPAMTSCDVTVEARHHSHHKGNIYHIRIDIRVPGDELVVSREHHDEHVHEDVYVAVRDAFDAARRQVEDYARKRRGKVKSHDTPSHGKVLQLASENDHGIIEASDGREIWFHRNSVLNDSGNKLAVGSEVRFADRWADEGYRASTVRVIGKHHIVS